MDIGAVRGELTTALAGQGLTVYDGISGAPQLPAVYVGTIKRVSIASMRLGQLDLAITILAAMADWSDAQARIDTALSTGITGSIIDAVKAAVNGTDIRSVKFVDANNVRIVKVGQADVLAADCNLEVVA